MPQYSNSNELINSLYDASIILTLSSNVRYNHIVRRNSPHKVAGGPLVQVQLNFAAVVETLVSSSFQRKYISNGNQQQTSKSKSLHCHVRPSTRVSISLCYTVQHFSFPFTDQISASRHWTQSNDILREQNKREQASVA